MSDNDSLTPVVTRQLLRCHKCGRTGEITHNDLMKYMGKGWPTCCGEVMAYYIEAKRPSYCDYGDAPGAY